MEGPLRTSLVNLAIATGQLATLLNAGLPLTTALQTVSDLTPCRSLSQCLADVHGRVLTGHYLSAAMRLHPGIFSRSYVALIKAGESSGQLASNLRRCAHWLEQDEQVVRKLKAAAVYPALVLVVATVLTLILFTSFLPRLFSMFAGSGQPLPFLTRFMIFLTWLLTRLWFWLALSVGVAWTWHRLREREVQERVQRWVRGVPLLGPAVRMATMARFAQCLGSLLECGLPLLHSWTVAAESSGDLLLVADARRVTEELKHGAPLALAVRRGTIYPHGFSAWLEMGERTASLPAMLDRMAHICRMEAETRLESLGALLEPLFIATMGGFVMMVLVSILLPLYGSLMQVTS